MKITSVGQKVRCRMEDEIFKVKFFNKLPFKFFLIFPYVFSFAEKELLRMVREVSEDRIYDTIEFNEFLQMMSKQMRNYTQDSLRDAFR